MNNKKYIVYFGHFELPDKNALVHRVKANCKALQAIGYNVILLGYSRAPVNRCLSKTQCSHDGFTCYKVLYPVSYAQWIGDLFTYKKVGDVLRLFGVNNCHAIIFTGVGVGNTRGLIKLSRRLSIPIVHDAVDWFINDSPNMITRLYRSFEERMMHSLYRLIPNYICISTFLSDKFSKYGGKTIVIPSLTFSDDNRFSNLSQYVPTENIQICYVGNPGYKGSKDRIDWCVKAFLDANITNSQLTVIGISQKQFEAQFPSIKFENPEHIVFIEKMSNAECVKVIADSDYFTFARMDNQTTRSGFPTKFAESLAIGTPVITTPTSDLHKYIKDGMNGYISESCTFESYYSSLLKALTASKEERVHMHECLSNSSLDEQHWRLIIKDYFEHIL